MLPQKQKNGESSSSHERLVAAYRLHGLGLGANPTGASAHMSSAEEKEEEEEKLEDGEDDFDDENEGEGGGDRKGKGKSKSAKQSSDTRTPEERLEASRRVQAAEKERATISDADLAAKGIAWDEESFSDNDECEGLPIRVSTFNPQNGDLESSPKRHDFFSNMANMPELFMELAKHLRIKDLLSLYAISIDFHETINGHMSHCMRRCAEHQAPEAAKLYFFKFYGWLCIDDPAGRPHPKNKDQMRKVPSLKWLQMVVHRDKTVRDILACMARQGHRMPQGMALSLKKMWLLMDISTSRARIHMIHNVHLFTDMDLYNIQLFIVKLDMRFNDPIDGSGDDSLRKLFLGQRGLTPLCKLLKRTAYTEIIDVVRLAIRYAYTSRREHRGMELYGVPAEEVGIMHTEGWGSGKVHLMRPDELIMMESVRRQMGLKNYLMNMMIWGYVDPITGKNIPVSEEEMYMSDKEVPPRDPYYEFYHEAERKKIVLKDVSDEEDSDEESSEGGEGDDDDEEGDDDDEEGKGGKEGAERDESDSQDEDEGDYFFGSEAAH